MSDRLLDLCRLLTQRHSTAVVGWRGTQAVDHTAFLGRIAAWHATLAPLPGVNFALYFEDGLEFAAALLAAWQSGKTVWLAADALSRSVTALSTSVDGFVGDFPAQCRPLRTTETNAPPPQFAALDADRIALFVHTSGTTGAAQAIPKRLAQMASEVETLDAAFGATIGAADVVATVSHQHIYGLLFKILWPLVASRPIHALSQNYPEQLAALLSPRSCILVSSPAHLKRLPEHLGWEAARAQVRAVFSSGGPLPAETALAAGALLGHVPTEVYGSSETGGIAWRRRKTLTDDTWTAFPPISWRIAEDGLLEVCSPHLADDQWLRIADRAEAIDARGFVLKGRSDRIVKIEEKRVSLDAVEALLRASPLVAAVRVVPVEEGTGRQALAAFVAPTAAGQAVLAGGKLALNRELSALLRGAVEAVAMPRRWRYLEQMPADAQGKTTQAALLALLDERPRELVWRELERDAVHVKCEADVPEDLLYFDGHFPGRPVLPGVVQLDWAVTLGSRYFALPPHFHGMNALKFQHMIQPGARITLELKHDPVKQVLQFRYFSAAGQHASGRAVFSPTR
jgi:acyl-coenzyme A synthetase/AMP-(fatty) acid ligase/3-hydroxymyristoyl/3-hydroxydecanoyl-(acyl carrier protein) dehydratase